MQPRASCTAISARCAGDESASELAYSDAGHTQTQGSFGQPDTTGLAGPAQPIFTAHQMGLCTFCLDCQPCPVSTSLAHLKEALKINTRGCTMLPRCGMTTPPIPQLRVYASSTQDHHDQLQAEAILGGDCHRIDRARTAMHNYATISAFKPSARSSPLRPCMTHGLNTPHAA